MGHLIFKAKLFSEVGRCALEQFSEMSRSFGLYKCYLTSGSCHTAAHLPGKMLPVKSSVSEHFEIPSDISGSYKAKCVHCGAAVSGRGQTTSNLHTHLKRKHPKIHEQVMTKKHPLSVDTTQPDSTLDTYVKINKKYFADDHRQKAITDALIMHIVGDLTPYPLLTARISETC